MGEIMKSNRERKRVLRTRDVRRIAKLLRNSGYSYQQSRHLVAEARHRGKASLKQAHPAHQLESASPFGPSTRPEYPVFWVWCNAIERYQIRYKVTV